MFVQYLIANIETSLYVLITAAPRIPSDVWTVIVLEIDRRVGHPSGHSIQAVHLRSLFHIAVKGYQIQCSMTPANSFFVPSCKLKVCKLFLLLNS